jgi:uncharacterized protein (TIGR02145 family)
MKSIIILAFILFNLNASENNPTKEEVAKLYVATFNRAPDSSGLDYWLNDSFNGSAKLSNIAQSFFDQPETQQKYPQGTTNRNFIQSVYNNLFNRQPDNSGWDYWENKLNIGEFSRNRFIEAVMNGAQDNQNGLDNTILTNKAEVGIYFADLGFTDTQQASCVLQGVTSDLDTVTFAKNNIDTNTISCDMWDDFGIVEFNSLQYRTVVSPFTQKVWLDRNIGATRVCETIDDTSCFGDYYQWGRGTDGHEKSNSQTLQGTVDTITNLGNIFISNVNFDWTTIDVDGSSRVLNWQKTDGSVICPTGFRVPTITELSAETILSGVSNSNDAFNNFLKLPAAGYRVGDSIQNNSIQLFWTSSPVLNETAYSIVFEENDAYSYQLTRRQYGLPVRCIKDTGEVFEDFDTPQFTSESNVNVDENQLSAITLTAIDENTLSYSIYGANSNSFEINSTTGVVTFKTAPDYETKSTYSFIATVTDGIHTVEQLITININDLIEDSDSINHNGYNYQLVESPYTGKIWLDRNVGASRVCQTYNDESCFGNYYQWGRNEDGHQNANSLTTNIQAIDLVDMSNDKFIVSIIEKEYDWAYDIDYFGIQRAFNWSRLDGASICPSGFRVPTLDELNAETLNQGITNRDDAFANFLKIPAAGYRMGSDGSLSLNGFTAFVWTNTTDNLDVRGFVFGGNTAHEIPLSRASGLSVRCIQD